MTWTDLLPVAPQEMDRLWNLSIPLSDALVRLGAALLVGFAIGLDREWRNRPAGLRTHMMVSLAAAVFTLVAFDIDALVLERDGGVTDPLRLLEAITAGVAFLAAGNIIRSGAGVEGLTTAAGLWLAGAMGLACGRGLFGLAALATVLAVFVLVGLRLLERPLNRGAARAEAEDDAASGR